MKAPRTIKFTAYLLGFVGAALLTGLMISQGAADVIRAVASVGWGLAAISGLHIAKLLSDTIGWLMVIPKRDRLRLHTGLWIHWLGESVSDLLPTARLGGDIITARLAASEGMALISAVASMLVDVTACVFTKMIYTVVGLVLLVAVTGQTSLVGPAAIGILIGILAIAGFYGIQRLGVFGWGAAIASRLAHSSSWQLLKQNGESLDRTVQRFYGRRRGVLACCAFAATSWVISAGEIWIALFALGVSTSFTTALILESVAQAVRGALFFVPGALGVQEGGYLLVGGLLGIHGEAALALSLIRRVRELILGIPGLIAWQLIEGGRLWRTRSFPVDQDTHRFTHVPTRTCR
ncbi:MAG: lysylphosphatidylglycerol synthase domain-containing protein [Chthoniobacterales bacterium]